MAEIIICDDDSAVRLVLETLITRLGHTSIICENIGQLSDVLKSQNGERGQVLICDIALPDGDGLQLLPKIRQIRPDLGVIIISARADLMTNIRANHDGACEFIAKPFDINHVSSVINQFLQYIPNISLQIGQKNDNNNYQIIGQSPKMQVMFRTIARTAKTNLSVLIIGESGTGKELVARAYHQYSHRHHKNFVALNMASIPKELIESELFGHEKGAFTGAVQQTMGKFAEAADGTLFLDEIGDMPLAAQTRLLRVLQDGEYSKVGSTKIEKSQARIIAATHRDLGQLVQKGDFRADLYYRLLVVPIHVPPLRDHPEDIPEFVKFFAQKATKMGLAPKNFSKQACNYLQKLEFPGNIRQLENLIYRIAALYTQGEISKEIIEKEYYLHKMPKNLDSNDNSADLPDMIRAFIKQDIHRPHQNLYEFYHQQFETALYRFAFDFFKGNQSTAAQILGLNRNKIRKKWQDFV